MLLICSACTDERQDIDIPEPGNHPAINAEHPMADSLQVLIDRHIAAGIPGALVAVRNADGLWIGAGGLARIETREPMRTDMDFLIYSQSKTYFGALALRLQEKGLLQLDRLAADYLPGAIVGELPGMDAITVRMLLNHTSGIPNFSDILSYQTEVWMNGTRTRSREAILKHVYGHPLNFVPGSEYRYSNTNYLLLTFVIEGATGQDHAEVLKEELLDPLNLEQTYYTGARDYPEGIALPNYYLDRFGDGRLENYSRAEIATEGYSSRGEGGLAASPEDVLKFLTLLADGEVLTSVSWQEMTHWVTGPGSVEPDYGLGLVYWNIGGGPAEFGHNGGGVAGFTSMFYFPGNRTAVFIAMNVGQFSGGAYVGKTAGFRNQVLEFIARQN